LALLAMFGFNAVGAVNSALPALELPEYWWVGFAIVVVFVVILSMLAARLTVMRALKRSA